MLGLAGWGGCVEATNTNPMPSTASAASAGSGEGHRLGGASWGPWRIGHEVMRLDGSVQAATRAAMVKRFNAHDEPRVFLISTRAGGIGINLTGQPRRALRL